MTLRWPRNGPFPRISRPQPAHLRTARSTFLTLGGFACFVVSAFIVGTVAGLIVLGLSCWLIEYLTGGGSR